MGFCWDTDLTEFYNGDLEKLGKLLQEKGEKPTAIAQVKRFLSLQPDVLLLLKAQVRLLEKRHDLKLLDMPLLLNVTELSINTTRMNFLTDLDIQ